MADPDQQAEAAKLFDLLQGCAKERGIALIKSFLDVAFAAGKIAGIDAALASLNPSQEKPDVR